jgi:hypothetical protein
MTRILRTVGLSLAALTALTLSVLPICAAGPQDDKPCPIEGAWKLVEKRDSDTENYEKPGDGLEMTKFVTGGRFVWTVVRDGRILAAAGGKYTVNKDKYTETIDYVHGDGQESLAGKTFEFTWKLDGHTWLHKGTIDVDNQTITIDEKWERCK